MSATQTSHCVSSDLFINELCAFATPVRVVDIGNEGGMYKQQLDYILILIEL